MITEVAILYLSHVSILYLQSRTYITILFVLFTGKDHKEEIPNKDLLRCGSLYLVFEYIEHDLGK